MSTKFINREDELAFLNTEYQKDSSSLVVIYGRRRTGKTSLIKKFVEDKDSLYFLASEEMERQNVNNLKNLVADFTSNPYLKKGDNFSWSDIFIAFKDHMSNEKKILVIDEFQYLGKINPAFPSIFQRIWDEEFKNEHIMVILCGSLINMMESQALNYSSPLYGRRTGQIKMKQIKFSDYHKFFDPCLSEDELVQYYSVTGGVPKYIESFLEHKNIFEGIEKSILNKQSYLYEEAIFLLENEVSEIGSYFSIIKIIAQGNHKLGNISTALGVKQSNLTKYLSTLINLDLLERQVPITETNPEKSKRGLYYIKDNFFEFWFKFIYPYKNFVEMDKTQYVMNKIKSHFIDNHVSFVYEKICISKLWRLSAENKLPFEALKIGRWWNNSEEIDIVGINDETRDIFFCECKYMNKDIDTRVFYDLLNKSHKVDYISKNKYYILFSRSGFSGELTELSYSREDLLLLN